MFYRLHLIVMLAGTENAFLKVGIQERDKDMTTFLWFKDFSYLEIAQGNFESLLILLHPIRHCV